MQVKVKAAKCIGIEAKPVVVEIEITRGIGIHLVGLADTAVKESLLRTTTALQSMDFKIPGKKIVINLAPADLHKSGSGYDLPIAVGIIAASGQREFEAMDRYLIMGELGLDGSVRSIPGGLPMSDLALQSGLSGVILPVDAALEASEFKDANIFGVSSLAQTLDILEGKRDCSDLLIWNSREFRKSYRESKREGTVAPEVDFADIIGQEGAKRGMEIAAAGGHNLILIGPPGSGKSSLAKALSGILPPMTTEEALVTSKIYSIAGGNAKAGLIRSRPFRSPHYSASMAAIIGGGGSGDNVIPGEITLAQNGVLFLDEFGQMPKSIIEALRGPVEDRHVTISRLKVKVDYPSSFMLVAASNPCPCGYYGEGDRCNCSPAQRLSYLSRLSGPIMDRMDLHVWMHPVESSKLVGAAKAEPSSAVAKRVLAARIAQKHRFAGETISTNAEMSNRMLEKYCPLSGGCSSLLSSLLDSMQLSMRACFRIIKVARTIADLDGSEEIKERHILEAAAFRFLDKQKNSY